MVCNICNRQFCRHLGNEVDIIKKGYLLALKPHTSLPFDDITFRDIRFAEIEQEGSEGVHDRCHVLFYENLGQITNRSWVRKRICSNDWILQHWVLNGDDAQEMVFIEWTSRLSRVN